MQAVRPVQGVVRQAAVVASRPRFASQRKVFQIANFGHAALKHHAYGKFGKQAMGTSLAVGAVLISSLIYWNSPTAHAEQKNDIVKRKSEKLITASELAQHTNTESCWVVIDGDVWDVTEFLSSHAGGAVAIVEHGGKDISALFNSLHPAGTLTKTLSPSKAIGKADASSGILVVDAGEEDEIESRRDDLIPVEAVVNLNQFEVMAKEVLLEDSRAFGYISSYADDGYTFNSTLDSFKHIRFVPRVAVPVGNLDTATKYIAAKETIPIPLFISPTAQNRQAHPDGELNSLKAAAHASIPQGVSGGSSWKITDLLKERDQLAKEGKGRVPIWWQHYIRSNRSDTAKLIKEAVGAGADAVIITLDTITIGNRESDRRVKKDFKKGESAITMGIAGNRAGLYDANLSWKDIQWIQSLVPGTPILVKGVTCVEDVQLAKNAGAAGVIISNHGGRQLDYAPPPMATLLRLHQEKPHLLKDRNFDVFIDGGFRRGTDVLKALCLGVKGVGLGRVPLYASACYGEEGVKRALQIMKQEIHTGMRLLGAPTISDLKPEMLEIMDGLIGKQL